MGPISQLIIQGTTLCNLNCDYCYLSEDQRKTKEIISKSILNKFIFRVYEFNSYADRVEVIWHCGEPFTLPISYYSEVIDFIEKRSELYAKEFNQKKIQFVHTFQTNGTLITQEHCNWIKSYNGTVNIGVSIDGPEYIHNKHRKNYASQGSFSSCINGIKLLQKNGIRVGVLTVLTRDTLKYPKELFEFYYDNNIAEIGFCPEASGGGYTNSSIENVDIEQDFYEFYRSLWDLVSESDKRMFIREFDYSFYALTGHQSYTKDRPSGCTVPFRFVTLYTNGDYSTFTPEMAAYGDYSIGNVEETSFLESLLSEKFEKMNAAIQKGVENCYQSCEFYKFCGGDGPAAKISENGSFESTTTFYCKHKYQLPSKVVIDDFYVLTQAQV